MKILNIRKNIRIGKNTGNPYLSVSLQFDEYRDGKGNMVWISGFGNKHSWNWKVGDEVTPEITQNDRGYYNFSYMDDDESARLSAWDMPATVGFVVNLLQDKVFDNIKPQANKPAPAPTQQQINAQAPGADDDVDPADIPF